ncbi:endonuclease VIII Nei2 [Mycolicibacterium diernhoferi]|uniref:DNA-(apurinic or apyrimidinic site) lyase n=1 Tax=Mycolicibacterium diernhoferi TaxID=1801 RepID=A0A1Q4H4A5_9MYCO|nr:endonuclease VIII Nei2 [Mycolicibacterium diernhoferi]OJZ62018.1 DNA glycosylase [Mycolicibacterium diernhoferi]OPE46173.1 DNA glycosylase [Mycolicibacterium diernhoferi]PEG51641.1 Fpg/Nei family DNA glycosylase [Mycolicibacterium diernhoferi]QYL24118.1 Fpg/Nei family DNA glycosylase [Mycolicibacterium diernhoferi]
MPEGDTVFRAATKLREALAGKTLTRCDIRVPRYATVDLRGQVVDEVLSRGKHLFIRVGEASIHSHLKMDGSWVIGSFRGAPHRIRIALGTADSVAYGVDLGILEVLERRLDQEVVAHLGPDLLGPDWDPQLAKANLIADPDRELADALLDQRVMAGVGNVYANELCFVLGRAPDAAVGTLADPLRMVQRARDMLWLNRNRPNRIITGNTRRGQQFWVYGRAGEPCRRCGTLIERDDSGDRIRYWCPSCQAA